MLKTTRTFFPLSPESIHSWIGTYTRPRGLKKRRFAHAEPEQTIIYEIGFFIDRPVFSTVISIIIVLVGLIGLTLLPVDQYPKIVPPVVSVSTSYPGANSQTVSQAVATPIEQSLNGTPGMLYMESTNSNNGWYSATLTFDISTDPDIAAVEVQNRVKLAESRLPAEVVQNGISVERNRPAN